MHLPLPFLIFILFYDKPFCQKIRVESLILRRSLRPLTLLLSSGEPLDQFQSNLTQSIF